MMVKVACSVVSLTVLFAGCATTPSDTEMAEIARVVVTPETQRYLDEVGNVATLLLRGGNDLVPKSAEWRTAAANNALATDHYRNRESRLYPSQLRAPSTLTESSWPRGLPRTCLALSGGGLRAAAFAMGAMDALHALGAFDDVDVISSSSGGSYANYWLTVALAQGKSLDTVFAGPGSPVLWPVRRNAGALVQDWWASAAALSAADLGLFALSMVTGVGAGPVLGPPMHDFGALPAGKAYADVLHRMLIGEPGPPQLTIGEIRRRIEVSRAPVPLIATTARVGSFDKCSATSDAGIAETRAQGLGAAVFEITPWRVGSDGIGYAPSPQKLTFAEAIAASASATDDPNARRCPFLSFANMRLGLAQGRYRPLPNVFPRPSDQRKTMGPYAVSLIDSTFADNLAVYALVRRVCEDILVIDAEHDPMLIFESYGYLKQHLARQGLDLSVPEVDAIAYRNRVDCGKPGASCTCADGICLIRAREACLRHGAQNDCIRSTELQRPVFAGVIRSIPFIDDESEQHGSLEIRITYLKLALDEDEIDSYPSNVRARYAAHSDRRTDGTEVCVGEGMKEQCSFPHESTYNQDFRWGKFEAYWELGRCNVERFMGSTGPDSACTDEPWPDLYSTR